MKIGKFNDRNLKLIKKKQGKGKMSTVKIYLLFYNHYKILKLIINMWWSKWSINIQELPTTKT